MTWQGRGLKRVDFSDDFGDTRERLFDWFWMVRQCKSIQKDRVNRLELGMRKEKTSEGSRSAVSSRTSGGSDFFDDFGDTREKFFWTILGHLEVQKHPGG